MHRRGVIDVAIETIINSTSTPISDTDINGDYRISDLFPEDNITLTPSKNTNHRNGISGFDVVLMSKHILEIELLDTPYKIIAADINRSGSVTTFDMVELRKLILFIDTEFQNNTSWRFVKKDFDFPTPANPFATAFPESISTSSLGATAEDYDFTAIKIGDVNCSADNELLAPPPCQDQLQLLIEEKSPTANEIFNVAVRAKNFDNIAAYQFALQYDAEKLEYMGLLQGNLNKGAEPENFKLPPTGGTSGVGYVDINTVWTKNDASKPTLVAMDTTLADTSSLFLLTFKALEAIPRLSRMLGMNNVVLEPAAWSDGDGCKHDVTLQIIPEGSASNYSDGQETITAGLAKTVQVNPNPTRGNLVFDITNATAAQNTILIYSPTGQLVTKREVYLEEGNNTITMKNISSWQKGLYFFTVTDEAGAVTTGKFVKQ